MLRYRFGIADSCAFAVDVDPTTARTVETARALFIIEELLEREETIVAIIYCYVLDRE